MKWSWLTRWLAVLLLATALAIPTLVGASACGKCAESSYTAVGPCGQCLIEILFDLYGGW